jgi:DNA-binding MarR family transcriptional regulator
MLVFARTVEHVLEVRTVREAVNMTLSPSKVQIIRLLGQKTSQTSTQIARFLGVSKPAVSQIIDSMVRAKMVTRKPATADRREVHLRLTKKGRDMYQAIRREQRHCVRNTVRFTPRTEIKRWVDALGTMAQAVGRAEEAYLQFCAQCGSHADDSCVLVGGKSKCLFTQYTEKAAKRKKAASKR